MGKIATTQLILGARLFLISIPTAIPAQEPLCGPERDALIDQLINYLGFDTSHRHSLVHRGEIIHTALPDLEKTPEDLAVAGVMLIIRRPMTEVVEVFLDDESFRKGHEVNQHGVIPEEATRAQIEAAFSQVGFTGEEQAEVKKILHAKPGPHLNLSRKEYSRLQAINPRDPQATEKVSSVYRDILIERSKSFDDRGITGIEPYDRKRNKITSPARELTAAIDGMQFLVEHFPSFSAALRHSPQPQVADIGHQDFWIKKSLDKRPLYVLSHRLVLTRDSYALAADLQYFVGHSYNSMLTIIGAVKCQENTLVVAVNHTFTDQVTGIGGGIKKKVGRKKVAENLARHFKALRTSVESRN